MTYYGAVIIKPRLHSLDGLRAIACVLVLVHHLGTATFASVLGQKGYFFLSKFLASITASGVELFFVLSAVVLVGPYVRGEKIFELQKYAWRRVTRLFPPYFAAWCLAGFTIFLATTFPTWWTVNAVLPTFSWSTWIQQLGIVYFGMDRYNFAWWSLTTEVAFYIMLPLLIPIFSRYYQRRVIFGILFIGSIIFSILSASYGDLILPVLGSLTLYASCFCAGLILACLSPGRLLAHSLWILGLIWVIISCTMESLNIHIGWGLIYFGLVALAMDRESSVHNNLSAFLWVWLGERSYSLFLVHYSVIGLVCHATSLWISNKSMEYFLITRFLSLIFSLFIAMLVFHFFERKTAHNLSTSHAFWPWNRETVGVE